MNKSEFIEKLSKELDTTKTAATKSFDAVTKCIAQSLKDNDELRFIGFGTFKAKHTKAKEVKHQEELWRKCQHREGLVFL